MKKFIYSSLILVLAASVSFAVPDKISFQGLLKDTEGELVAGTKSIVFSIYSGATGGTALWSETQSVAVEAGLYIVQLGSVTPITPSIFSGATRYLGINIDGSGELSPRATMLSVPYAYRATIATSVESASGNYVSKTGDTMTGPLTVESDLLVTGNVTAADFYGDGSGLTGVATAGGDTDWTIGTKILTVGVSAKGIAQYGVEMYGTNANTHINLGFGTSVTGTDGQNYSNCTIGGGLENTASNLSATVGGGWGNIASGSYSLVAGGSANRAIGNYATVGGGDANLASGLRSFLGGGDANEAAGSCATVGGGEGNATAADHATVGGGLENEATAACATVPGGQGNIAGGDHSWAGGQGMELSSAADRTFVWGHNASGATIAAPDAFIIYSGNVGIGTMTPEATLHVVGSLKATGTIEGTSIAADERAVSGSAAHADGYAGYFEGGRGVIMPTSSTQSTGTAEGTIRYSSGHFYGYTNTGWIQLDN
jgi:hypothetical protein